MTMYIVEQINTRVSNA